ncbi:hypothetical protein M422DRAFT_25356 [Sphaerobolus stellatus SS14]|nr:hypothetical protein M422DRAFT_25356 [Sphaerobolus stellatus SS14]
MPKTNSEDDFGGSITSDESGSEVDMGPSSPIQATQSTRPFEFDRPSEAFSSTRGRLNIDTYVNPSQAVVPPSTPPAIAANGQHRRQHSTPMKSAKSATSPQSPLASIRQTLELEPPISTLKGANRFRATVRKIMAMHRTSTYLGAFRGAGAEPGIDPRRASAMAAFGHIREACSIQIVDYSSVRSKFTTYDTNKSFIDYLDHNRTAKPDWAKVRWIAVGGISWDVISALALVYELHPLALEDVLHKRNGHMRSKADYYHKHLFLRVLCHALGDRADDPLLLGGTSALKHTNITDGPRSLSPARFDDDEKGYEAGDETLINRSGVFRRKTTTAKSRQTTARDIEKGRQETPPPAYNRIGTDVAANALAKIEELTAGDRVNMVHRNFYMFLFRDGTVISIHQTANADFFDPIMTRLRTRDTVLRSTADASLLVQSQLDLVVDQTLEMVEEYQKMILKLERDILVRPKIKTVRQLHILSGDLSSHQLTIAPLKSLVYGLRRYDIDRCVAVAQSQAETSEEAEAVKKVTGYMSHKSKVYLADVHDHLEHIISSLEQFANVAENLINYTFNMASYNMNETMRLFTIVTIIFLPLTFLSGYFGMNFMQFGGINHSDIFFWEIALPIMVLVIPMFLWKDIIRVKHYWEKKLFVSGARGRRH